MKKILIVTIGDLDHGIMPSPRDLEGAGNMLREAFSRAKDDNPAVICVPPVFKFEYKEIGDDMEILVYSAGDKLVEKKKEVE